MPKQKLDLIEKIEEEVREIVISAVEANSKKVTE